MEIYWLKEGGHFLKRMVFEEHWTGYALGSAFGKLEETSTEKSAQATPVPALGFKGEK